MAAALVSEVVCLSCGSVRVARLHADGPCPACGDLGWTYREDALARPEELHEAMRSRAERRAGR